MYSTRTVLNKFGVWLRKTVKLLHELTIASAEGPPSNISPQETYESNILFDVKR